MHTIQDEGVRNEALSVLAPYLKGQLLRKGLQAALAIEDNKAQVVTLGKLAPHLSGDAKEYAFAQGFVSRTHHSK